MESNENHDATNQPVPFNDAIGRIMSNESSASPQNKQKAIQRDFCWTEDLLKPQGLVGEIANWIGDVSCMQQPKYALAASLCICATLLGNGVEDESGQQTNIYTIAVGGSCSGKNDPFMYIKHIFKALGRENMLAGELTSDSAAESLLAEYPVRLLVLDEVGHYVSDIKSAGRSNSCLKTVMSMLTKLWSAASSYYLGKSRAPDTNGKPRPRNIIHHPCVSIYGATVPVTLFQNLTGDDLRDGSIARFLLFISKDRPRREQKNLTAVPDSLSRNISDALCLLGIKPLAADKPYPISAKRIVATEAAKKVFDAFEDEKQEYIQRADDGNPPLFLYGKAVENAKRVALIVASCRNPENPMIDEYDARYAVKLVSRLVAEAVEAVQDNVATNETEKTRKRCCPSSNQQRRKALAVRI